MTALRPATGVEVSCRNDAGAGVGDRVTVLEWSDPRRITQGLATALVGQAAAHADRLAAAGEAVTVRVLGEGTVQRVIQWLRVDGLEGVRLPARVVVQLDTAG